MKKKNKRDFSLKQITDYYNQYNERERLSIPLGQVEYLRTCGIILRYLPGPPLQIVDIGGAAGRYACWLAALGYEVHLVDPVFRHIEQAGAASQKQSKNPVRSCTLGDARHLAFPDSLADAVLFMGPMYHLTEYPDRMLALKEALRILKRGGWLFAVGISRFASSIDGFMEGYFMDPVFMRIMIQDLSDGQHRNPTDNPDYFTSTFFHHPSELQREVIDAGFQFEALMAIEGIGYMVKDLEKNWEKNKKSILEIIQKTEREPSLIGASPHIMCVARKRE
jgi:ubiquinone/menaquinone biosynthesis C-methylase UbiE